MDELPDEILLKIVEYLDVDSWIKIFKVSKRLKSLAIVHAPDRIRNLLEKEGVFDTTNDLNELITLLVLVSVNKVMKVS